uniref:Uncharacterized protein n=3 Tax=Zea mays TaxID=4577 RepID=A0A804Q4J1_MAIZE
MTRHPTTTACSTPTSAKTAPAPGYGLEQRLPNGSSKKGTPRSASQRWMPDKPRTPSSRRTYSIGEPGKLTTGFSRSARMGNLNPRDRAFASLSNIADLKSVADAATEDLDDEFDHIDESHYVDTEDSTKHKKKSPIFRRCGELAIQGMGLLGMAAKGPSPTRRLLPQPHLPVSSQAASVAQIHCFLNTRRRLPSPSLPIVLIFLLLVLIVTSQFEWKQHIGEAEANPTATRRRQQALGREDAVKEKSDSTATLIELGAQTLKPSSKCSLQRLSKTSGFLVLLALFVRRLT